MKKILIISLIVLSFADSKAQLFPTLGGQRAGISTAQFLKIGVGARAIAMGDAFIAVANDASALYWNPAGLVQTEDNQVILSHNEWLVEIKNDFIGASYHLSPNDVVGVSFVSLHTDDMPVTTETQPFGTGQFFSFGDIAFSLTYSKKMTDKFSFGGTVRYMEETLANLKMRGVLIDLGTLYWTGLGSTRFAVAITNFGNELTPDGKVTLYGGNEKSDWQSFAPPTMFRLGFAFEPYQDDTHKITASVQLNHPNDNSENVSFGIEYGWKKIFYLRGGYKLNVEDQNFTFGAGINAPLGIANVKFDYAYANFTKLGSAHRFSIIFGLY